MAKTVDQMSSIIMGDDEKVDALTLKYSKQLKNLVYGLVGEIKRLRTDNGRIPPGVVSMKMVVDLLERAGILQWTEIDPFLIEAASIYSKTTRELIPEAEDMMVSSKQTIFQIIKEVKEGSRLSFNRISDNMASAVYSQLLANQFTPVPLKDSAAILAARQNVSKAWCKTWLNTAMAAVGRRIELQQGEDLAQQGIDVFYLYLGPKDKNTRDFCRVLKGKAIRRKDMGKFKPPGGLDFQSHGGGYNCRHRLNPVPAAYVKSQGIEIVTKKTIDRANKYGVGKG